MVEALTEEHLPPFGDEAHRVLARARAAAHRLRHATLGTEHLLVGCAEESRGQASELLFRAGMTPAVLLSRVKLLGNRSAAAPPVELAMAPGLRATLRLARLEAKRLRDAEVRSEHLLLATMRERTSSGAVVLRAAGLDLQAFRAAIVRGRVGDTPGRPHVAWLAKGPYGALAVLATVAIVSALTLTIRWLVTIRPALRSAYLYDLLIPVALMSIGMVGIGASRIEAMRQAADREALLATWSAQSAAARIAAALALAQNGAIEVALPMLEAAVDREMPESDVRAALSVLARWLGYEDLAPYGYFARGLLRAHAGQTQACLTDLEKAVRLRPDDTRWQGLYGVWLARANRDDQAEPLLRTAVAGGAVEPLIALELAVLLLRRGAASEAAAHAQAAAQALPGASRPLGVLAAARYLGGATADALAALQAVRIPDAEDLLAHAVHAAVLVRGGRATDAVTIVRDAAASTIERPGYLAAIEGWALAALGNEREASLAFASARERDPGLATLLKRLRQGLGEHQLDVSAGELDLLLARLA